MKFFIFTILILVHGMCASVHAADPPVSLKGQGQASKNMPAWNLEVPFSQSTKTGGINALIETGNYNMLADPGMEATGTSSWVAVDGSISLSKSTTAANVAFGNQGLLSSAPLSNASFRSIAITVPNGLAGQNGYAYCRLKDGGSIQNYIQVTTSTTSGSGVLATSATAISSSYTKYETNFIFPSSGSVYLWVFWDGAAAIKADDCYLGPALNLSQVSQARFYGSAKWPSTASCQWSVSSTSASSFSADTDCTSPTGSNLQGNASAPATKIPGITFTSMPPGTYQVIAKGIFEKTGTTSSTRACYRFTDGTNTTNSNCATSANTTSKASLGSVLGEFQYTSAQSNVTIQLQGLTDAAAETAAIIMDPSVTSSTGLEISVYYFPSSSQTAIQNPLTFHPTYSANVVADASCSLASDVTQTGTWISSCTRNASGDYTLGFTSGTFSATPICQVSVTRGLGNTRYTVSSWISSLSSSSATVYWGYNDDQQGTIAAAIANVDDSAQISLKCTSTTAASTPVPILVGSVTSNSSGAERIERASITGGNPPSISSQSGSWLTYSSRTGAGDYTWTITSGIFSGTPACTLTPIAATRRFARIQSVSSTSVRTTTEDSAGTGQDDSLSLECMGPK